MKSALLLFILLGCIVSTGVSLAGEVVTGNIQVCRKPMLAGMVAAIRAMQAPADNAQSRQAFRDLQELQRDEQDYCFFTGSVEITGGGDEQMDVGWGQWCREYTGIADGEEVFVAYGSQKRQYGSCP